MDDETTLYSQPRSDPHQPQPSIVSDDFSSSPRSAAVGPRSGGKRDISQFVKYLLQGSGIDEDSVDYAALRNELEHLDVMPGDESVATQQQKLPRQQPVSKNGMNGSSSLLHQQVSIDVGSVEGLPMTDGDLDELSAHIRPATLHSDHSMPQQTASGMSTSGKNAQQRQTVSFEEALSDLLSRLDSVRAEVGPTTADTSGKAIQSVDEWTIEKLNASLNGAGLPTLPSGITDWSVNGHSLKSFCWAYQTAIAHGQAHYQKAKKLTQALSDIGQKASLLAQLYPNALGYTDRPSGKLELDNARLQERCHMLEDLVAQTHDRYADLEQRVMCMEEEEERLRVRAEAIIKDVTGREPTLPRALAGEIREIIAYYEEKQRVIEAELDRLRENQSARKLSDDHSVHKDGNGHADGTQTHLASVSRRTASPTRKSTQSPMPPSVERMKSVYLDEIHELRDELQTVTAAFEEVQQEKEVLQLKLATTKVDVGVEAWERKRLSTRELIKRDKEFYKLKLYKVDDMSSDDSKELIKDVCRKLKIQSFRKITSTLDDIAKTIRLLPQLQQFIYLVDAVVWAPPKVLDQFLSIKEHTRSVPATKNPPHKLTDTADAIKRWRHLVDHELKTLRGFRQAVHQLVLERDEPAAQNSLQTEDLNACLQEIKNLVHYHATKGVSMKRPAASAGKGRAAATALRMDNEVTMQSLDALLGKVNDLERDWDQVKSP